MTEMLPIPMILFCPRCGIQHFDAPEPERGWTNPPHRSHLCASCGTIWRPADVTTTGVAKIETRGSADHCDRGRREVTIPTININELVRRHEEYLRAVRGIINAHHQDPVQAVKEVKAPQEEYVAWWASRGVKLVFKG
jgi:hypothetical protein